jgi:hypothetical protein
MSARGKKAAAHAEASKGRVTATDAAGRRLGVYKTDREAMAAILAAARAVRADG